MRYALALALLVGCARNVRDDDDPRVSPMERAFAIGLIALSTGAATTASQCPTTTRGECVDLTWRAGSVVLGVSIAAAAQAWLEAQDDEVAAAERRRRSDAARRGAHKVPASAPASVP